jgi:ribosome-associated toxin RatA of RatAB toxin-antitoxin module
MSTLFFRYGIIAAFSPRMATQNTLNPQKHSIEKSMNFQCFNEIIGAGRFIPAASGFEWRYSDLIKPN